jgi:hypothetical protein
MVLQSVFREVEMYYLDDPLATRPLRLGEFSPWVNLELADKLFFGEEIPKNPVLMTATMGGQVTDFLWTTFMPLLCVSNRVVTLLQEHHVTGWATYSVEVHDRKKNFLPGYHGFAVTGAMCNRDRSRCRVITKPAPTPTGRPYEMYKGLYFDETQWDGSDIFLVYYYCIITTEKVQRIFKKHKITNARMLPLADVEYPIEVDKVEPY